MRHISSSSSPHSAGGASKKTSSSSSKNKRFGSSFATKAFVATATASTSYAAYYCATAFLFSSAASVHGESTVGGVNSEGKKRFHEEKKTDDRYGIQYAGFDSYPGIEMDDGTGVSTEAFKAASVEVVARALEAAGLDEKTGIMKGVTIAGGNDITLDPKHAHRIGLGMACPSYGCPFLPMDMHYDEEVKVHLENMRKGTSSNNESDVSEKENTMLKTSGSEKAATLTLIGYKGGRMEDQINQDRALALAPYSYWNINSSSPSNTGDSDSPSRPIARLIGAFDGHAKYGEKVSEYVAKTLPALLGSKLVEHDATMSSKEKKNDDDDVAEIQRRKDHDIGRILHETFLELDATSPAHPSGGCTASAVLQVGTRIYIANAGDSRSFVGVHVTPPTAAGSDAKATTAIVFGTREDKAHLMKERERVEHMGGTVYLPNGFMDTGKGTTRVLYKDPTTGSTSGLAMSRSIGDWDAGAVGVIPDPLVDILDTKEIKKRVLESLNKACGGDAKEVEIDPASGESLPSTSCVTYTEKNVKVFAVSATDGLLDYLPEEAIVNHVAKGLYETTKVGDGDSNAFGEQKTTNPLLVCEDLIYAAAQGWQEDKGGRYRDDIAIAMTDLETE
eukprot:CAMPEP_0196137860 /NCGR_PEP_ID=MMETSP0910-20130528/5703_1 /TAXON_ID=49265 /ORGANISM="Thalassiosira rotula, Strain GSO102" /LENGTH=617 /DNA_ID=CAMNT_0041398377 /DNA_START=402 /DNA_END=2255 /DNA_ORIENTATION=+